MSRPNGPQRNGGPDADPRPFLAPTLPQLRPHPTAAAAPPPPPAPPSAALASAATTAIVASRSASSSPRPPVSAVSDEVWARAIHAVKFQKMSLRQAAQLYGVHHMSLHRRVRGRYSSTLAPSSDIRSFLSPDDEAEVLGVLREQFLHERRITSDDVRFVVRAIASQGGKQSIPAEFPPSRWIMDFKRVHGFTKLNSYGYPPSSVNNDDDSGSNYSGYSSSVATHQLQQLFSRDTETMDTEDNTSARNSAQDEEFGTNNTNSTSSNGGYEGGMTTGSSSGGSYENGESEKRTYRLSHSVPAETWEKAIAAVEQQGMSLRAAAKMYGVHFAALHRRVKKRAQGKQGNGIEGYFQPDDEAGIIRVVVARAELGVLMTFDELMDLVQRAALRNLPDISVEAARKLMTRFQSRNEHSIRHIISDWPPPRANPLNVVPRVINSPEPRAAAAAASSAAAAPAVRSFATRAANPPALHEPLPRHQELVEAHRVPLPSLRSTEFAPPPASSSIFSRHPFPSAAAVAGASSSSSQRRLIPQGATHRQHRFNSREEDLRYEEEGPDSRRGSGSGSSDGDAVMFV